MVGLFVLIATHETSPLLIEVGSHCSPALFETHSPLSRVPTIKRSWLVGSNPNHRTVAFAKLTVCLFAVRIKFFWRHV